MDYNSLIASMHHHARTIELLARGISDEQARRKPNAESWSIVEVVNHLYDEEREDFRVRLDIILYRPDDPLPPIRPAEWVTERSYNTRDLDESVNNFLAERENSLKWLNSLQSPNWDAIIKTTWGADFHAGDMLTSWVAHDVLHLRQLVELHYALVKADAQPYDVGYAGDW